MNERSANIQGRAGSRLAINSQPAGAFRHPLFMAGHFLGTCLFLLVLLGFGNSFVSAAQRVAAPLDKRIVVITSQDVAASRQALRGFTVTVPHRIVAKHNLGGDPRRAPEILAEIQSETRPDLILAVGTLALQAVAHKVRDIPVVYAMVLNPPSVVGSDARNVTGASMNVPPGRIMRVFKDLGPKIRRVGVIFNPDNTGYLVEEAATAAKQRGLQLVPRGVRSTGEAIRTLDALKGQVDALWMVPDPTVLADAFVTATFLFSYRNNVPVIGLSETQTDKGALLSLGFGSSEDVGKQAGEIANAILRGKKPADVPFTMARQLKVTVNPNGAKKLRIDLPESVLATASNVVQAPVYEEGDWWTFQVKRKGKPPEQYRVTYTKGKFESNHPDFLTVSKHYDSISFLPLISVNLRGAEKRWFDFPLRPRHTWTFRYRHIAGQPGRSGIGGVGWRVWRWVDGTVIGPTSQPINTSAGKFLAIEIHRRVYTQWGSFEFTYFYSPKTKSTVKVIASGFAGNDTARNEFGYEMELVAYGSENPVVIPLDKESIAGKAPAAKAPSKIDWSRIEAPVYEEGDWWVYRANINGHVQEHRIEYRNGRFESDDAMFLRGEAYGFWYSNVLPWATVHLNDPQRQWVEFPIAAGNKWNARYQVGSGSFDADVEVIGRIPKLVETLAGRFAAVEISRLDQMLDHRPWGELIYFYSPEAKSVVKLSAKYFVSIYGTTHRDYFNLELIDYGVKTPPAPPKITTTPPGGVSRTRSDWSRVEAPVYEEGDWWVYRASVDGVAEVHKIEYKNGRFHSDDPGFLRGEDISGNPSSLPWATVYLTDPQKKWLDFPLTKGKSWQFRYPRYTWASQASVEDTATASAEAVGAVTRPVKTEAGRFRAFEILRIDGLNSWAKLTYFYSPETKSVVKLSAAIRGFNSSRRRFELELLSYGHRGQTAPSRATASASRPLVPAVRRVSAANDWDHVKAPNYEDGDWWAFRVKTGEEAQTYKFVRKNGVLESDIAFFTGTPSMVLSAAYRPTRDIHFPLRPGKKWNSRYRGPLTEFAFMEGLSWRSRLIETTGEVVGVTREPVETAAGKFKVIEVRMRLRSGGRTGNGKTRTRDSQELEFTGFYSPETKSLVKLIGKLKGAKGANGNIMEIELVDYGGKR